MPAATDALREFILPFIGIERITSHFSLTRRLTPLPSLPITSPIEPVKLHPWPAHVRKKKLSLSSHLPLLKGLLHKVLAALHFGEGDGTPLQHSCLENPINGGAWWAAAHGVAKSRTQLSEFTSLYFHFTSS